MKEKSPYSFGSQVAVAALFAAIGLAALYVFVVLAEPAARTHRPPFRPTYSEKPLEDLLSENGFEKRLGEIASAGERAGEYSLGRLTGSPGCDRTAAQILDAFREAGLEIQTQEFQVVVPVTEYCEILGEDGRPLDGVRLYPFEPAGMMPVVLPKEGIKARLVRTENTSLRYLQGNRPEDTVVLTYLDSTGDWASLAAVGARAVIVREDELSKKMRGDPDLPGQWSVWTTALELPFPRFLARGPIDKYAGQQVTLRCKVTWQSKKARNIIGVLKSKQPKDEALIVTSFYDSNSIVPDLAPGAEQSVSAAAMLEYARALSLYRDSLQRDVIFVATAGHCESLSGMCRLVEAIETFTKQRTSYRSFEERRKEEDLKRGYALRGGEVLDSILEARKDPNALRGRWLKEAPEFRRWFESSLKTVAGEVNLERKEEMLQARLAYLRAGSPVFREGFDFKRATDDERKDPGNSHPLMRAYLEAKKMDNRSANMMQLPIWEVVQREEFETWRYADKTRKHLQSIVEYHAQQMKELDDLIAVRTLFEPYKRTFAVNLELYSGGHRKLNDLSVLVGLYFPGTTVEPQVEDLANLILEKTPRANGEPAFKVINWGPRDMVGSPERPNRNSTNCTGLESAAWFRAGVLSFTVVNYDFFPPKVGTAEDTLDGFPLDVLRQQIPAVGKALLAVAHGDIPFKKVPVDKDRAIAELHGAIVGSAGVSSMVPSHPMTRNTFVHPYNKASRETLAYAARGIRMYPILQTNPYGEYSKKVNFDFSTWMPCAVDAARFDDDGRMVFVKDVSPASQAVFTNEDFGVADILAATGAEPRPIRVALFRCVPVSLYDWSNPKTLKPFKAVNFLTQLGLSAPGSCYLGRYATFLAPDTQFYVGLLDGAAENPEIQVYRAFMLNADPAQPIGREESDIYGRGYLAADFPDLTYPHAGAAASMLRTSEKRLNLQKRYAMADPQMLSFHERAKEWLADAQGRRARNDPAGAVVAAGTSLAYEINNHPVIRTRISHAVIGILWYLALLVPFVFFCEKLVFGFADIRKQLLATGLIFLVVFSLLRLFHPAFQMVRSSLVILLGFIILLLTTLVTLMVAGKFRQNIKELRSKEGRVEGADISRSGVLGTAFLLGLNNMRRRKVRTGLTCVTLILITFVMICFTSVSTDLVNVEYATGRSVWNGIMLRDANFLNMQAEQISSIKKIYGERYPVTSWQWLATELKYGERRNPEVLVDREFQVSGSKVVKRAKVGSAVRMEWNEPMFSGIDRFLQTKRRWFPRPPETRQERFEAMQKGYKAKKYVIVPDNVARDLGLKAEDVNTGSPTVNIRGEEYEVFGIMDSVELTKCIGLDGQPILPYDLNSVQALGATREGIPMVPETIGRLPGSQVIIVNELPLPKPRQEEVLTLSCSILFPREPYRLLSDEPEHAAVDYRQQRRLVDEYLERTGEQAYYAIDGVCYYGSRQRAKSFAGLLELLVPILIASLTVFNTMRGSVYERKDEIYVYNAVGIAPNHVFFIFMAEACVFAVMGAMIGYLLSQASGRLLTAFNLTGGLNMDYSSIETIYASLAIVGAVMLSTVLPARDAARLASPSGAATWTMPEAEYDTMKFNLPFTFTARDRVAVVSYFCRWLDANGAGSSGPFYCAPPEVTLKQDPSEERSGGLLPVVLSTIWLKPYDLGVSQRMEILLPTDPETREYIAHITLVRLSGNVAAWNRTVKPFLGVLRKQFLNWRVTGEAERNEMFEEARRILNECAGREAQYV